MQINQTNSLPELTDNNEIHTISPSLKTTV